jgi:hypothetical protein
MDHEGHWPKMKAGPVPIDPAFKSGAASFGRKILSAALALSSCDPTAIVPLDGRSDRAAVLPRADRYAARTETDGKITISPVAPFAALTNDLIIPVAANLHVYLRHFEAFCVGRNGSNGKRCRSENSRSRHRKSNVPHGLHPFVVVCGF